MSTNEMARNVDDRIGISIGVCIFILIWQLFMSPINLSKPILQKSIILLAIILFLFIIKTKCQPLDKYTKDTLYLTSFNAKKVVAYKLDSVTIYMDYNDYRNDLYILWKRYNNGNKPVKKDEHVNPDWELRWHVIDSVYTILKNGQKNNDTIYLLEKIFEHAGLRGPTDLIANLIEKKQCAIIDYEGHLQLKIIRYTGYWYKGPLAAWAGRRYFLVGHSTYFTSITDSIS